MTDNFITKLIYIVGLDMKICRTVKVRALTYGQRIKKTDHGND